MFDLSLPKPNGKKALEILEKETVDVVITDINMPEMDGIQLTEEINKSYDCDVIMMTGYVKDLSYGDAIAESMTLSRDQITGIQMAGVIHDIGKISIPSEILSNAEKRNRKKKH